MIKGLQAIYCLLKDIMGVCFVGATEPVEESKKWSMNTIMWALAGENSVFTYDGQEYPNEGSQQAFVATLNAAGVPFYLEGTGKLCIDEEPAGPICRRDDRQQVCTQWTVETIEGQEGDEGTPVCVANTKDCGNDKRDELLQSILDAQLDANLIAQQSLDKLCSIDDGINKCDDDEEPCTDVFTESANCQAEAGCTVFKDFNHKGGSTSVQTLENVQITRQSCEGEAVTTTGIGTTVEDVADNVNTNLETWINTNLGPFGFAASPATVVDTNNNDSPMTAFMNLKYPTCAPWTFTVLNTPTHYSSTTPLFSGVKYTYNGTNLVVELVDASGNVVATPPNTAGNLGSLPLQDC